MENLSEFQAADQLDIKHYPFKWKRAQEMALDEAVYSADMKLLPYWERVRQLYLELGGEKICAD